MTGRAYLTSLEIGSLLCVMGLNSPDSATLGGIQCFRGGVGHPTDAKQERAIPLPHPFFVAD